MTSLPIGIHKLVVPRRTMIRVGGGQDAVIPFLQGLTTADVRPLAGEQGPQTCLYTAFLNPKGRVMYDALLLPEHDPSSGKLSAVWIEAGTKSGHESHLPTPIQGDHGLLGLLRSFKLRAKVDIDPLLDWVPLHTWRDTCEPTSCTFNSAWRLFKDPRCAEFGYRLYLPYSDANTWLNDCQSGTLKSTREYDVRRILYGIGEGVQDHPTGIALPLECNFDLLGGIHWRKGCYVGQELTVRTKHTGVVRKRLLPVQFYRNSELLPLYEKSQFESIRQATLAVREGLEEEIRDVVAANLRSRGAEIAWMGTMVGNLGLGLVRLPEGPPYLWPEGIPIGNSGWIARPFLPHWMNLNPAKS